MDEADHSMIADYQLISGVLVAADYGVAQRRPRAIVVGSRVGPPRLPQPTHAAQPSLDLNADNFRPKTETRPW